MTEAQAIALMFMVSTATLAGIIVWMQISLDRLNSRLTEWHVRRTMMGRSVDAINGTVERFRRGELSQRDFLVLIDYDLDSARCQLDIMESLIPKKNPGGSAGVESGP